MKIQLHVEQLEYERRFNHLRCARPALGRFLPFRDDHAFIWLGTEAAAEACEHIKQSTVRNLAPAVGSTVTEPKHLERITDPILELRQYRVVPGTRERFAAFLLDRSLDEHTRLGMAVYGPFNDLDDENVMTWFRGFPSLADRDRLKTNFYQGRVWLEELEQVAMPMIEDYSNVILVTPV